MVVERGSEGAVSVIAETAGYGSLIHRTWMRKGIIGLPLVAPRTGDVKHPPVRFWRGLILKAVIDKLYRGLTDTTDRTVRT